MFNELQKIGFSATCVKNGTMKNAVHTFDKPHFHATIASNVVVMSCAMFAIFFV